VQEASQTTLDILNRSINRV